MEPWRKVWRDGVAPSLSTAGLEALRTALIDDDVRLLQGTTASFSRSGLSPAACWQSIRDVPVSGACAIGFCGWQGAGLDSVGKAVRFFALVCDEAGQRLRVPGALAHFLDWFDRTPRDEMRRLLLDEVNATLSQRASVGG